MTTLTFTSSGTWTALASSVDCQCTGEGGNGGTRHTSGGHNFGGGGGGGGEYAEETALALTISNNYSFTIGAGGSGTDTSFPGDSVTVTAHHGLSALGQTGAGGGSGSTNGIHFSGSSGTSGSQGSFYPAGSGGDAAGPGGTGTGGAGGGAGANGSAPGGGGGGGNAASIGAGAAGQIVLTFTASVSGTATLAGAGTLTAQATILSPTGAPGPMLPSRTWLRRFGYHRLHAAQPGKQLQTLTGTAALAGTGTLTARGGTPAPAVVNQWANSYGQGTTFTNITSALQSCVVPLNVNFQAGPGSGTPTAGNWLFCIVSWTQFPAIAKVHVGVADDIHEWWREFPGSSSSGLTRTSISYVPNIGTFGSNLVPQNVYVAPDMEVAAINVLVVEIAGLGPWDTVTGTSSGYTPGGTSVSLSLSAPPRATFFIAATGGDNIASGQAFLPAGWTALDTQTQTNGSNALADNILTAAVLPSSNSSQSVSGTSSSAENMSGFILGVEVNADSPIPAGHNPNWPLVITEAGFGSGVNTPDSEVTWTDISNRPWNWDETTGIQFELAQLQASNITIEMDNFDSALSPLNASSPYYPGVVPGTPIRMRFALGVIGGNTVNRWYVLQRNAAQWAEEIPETFRKYVRVSATDLWAALNSVPPTFYRSEVYEDGPYAYYPCDDQPGTSGVLPVKLLNAALGNTNPLNILLSPNGGAIQPYYDEAGNNATQGNTAQGVSPSAGIYATGMFPGWNFGDPPSATASITASGNAVEPTPGSAAWQASGQAGNTGSYGWFLSCHDTGFPPLSGGITIEVWFNAQFYGSANEWFIGPSGGGHPVTQQPYNSPITIWEIATGSGPVCLLQLDTSGHLNLITAGVGHSIYTASDLRSNSWHMVTVTLTQTTWAVWLDGGANAQVSGTASMASAWSWLILNGDLGSNGGSANGLGLVHGGNIALAHIAVYPAALPYYRIMDHYWAAVSAFGQLPAPTAVQIAWNNVNNGTGGVGGQLLISGGYAPDGTALPTLLGSAYNSQNGASVSAIVTATAPGGVTSGPSAWTAGSTAFQLVIGDTHYYKVGLWISWTGLAPGFSLYTDANLGSEKEAALVNGSGDSFLGGYGASANGQGVCETGNGDGSAPPAAASAIGDTVGERIERLMRGGRCVSPNRCIDPAPLLVQAPGQQGGGLQAGAAIQAIQQSDSGMLFVDNLNHLTYWQRPHLAAQYSSPVWNIGPSAGRYPYYKEIQWITDPQRIWNAITIEPLSPTGASLPELTPQDASGVLASQVKYGAQPLQITSWLQDQSEMQAQANWLFSTWGTPRRRAQEVRIDAASNPVLWPLVVGINVGDIVTLEDWQIGGGGTVYTMRVTQIRRHFEYGAAAGGASEVVASVWLTLDFEPASYWT